MSESTGEYVETLQNAFVELLANVTLFLPELILAIVVFLLGLLVANILKSAVIHVVKVLKVDELMERIDVKAFFEKLSINLDVAELLGWIVKWSIIIFALIGAADILQWDQVTDSLSAVITYIPNIIISVVILLLGTVLANFVYGVVSSAMEAAKMQSTQFIAGMAKWVVIVFSFMAALVQLGIAESLINILFTGFIAMVALAGGLAFGLGGRAHATRALDKLQQDFSSRKRGEE